MTTAQLLDSRGEGDQLSRVLSNKQRRRAIEVLETTDGPIATADLAIELARRETGDDDSDTMFETAKQARVNLHHCHLPKLEEVDLVDYDAEERLVTSPESSPVGAASEPVKVPRQ